MIPGTTTRAVNEHCECDEQNDSHINDDHDTRYAKMVEWMDNVEMAIQIVCASKVYTSAEFKREKDNFHVNI